MFGKLSTEPRLFVNKNINKSTCYKIAVIHSYLCKPVSPDRYIPAKKKLTEIICI